MLHYEQQGSYCYIWNAVYLVQVNSVEKAEHVSSEQQKQKKKIVIKVSIAVVSFLCAVNHPCVSFSSAAAVLY